MRSLFRSRKWVKRLLSAIFFTVVAGLLVVLVRSIDWGEVVAAMRRRPVEQLAGAALLAAASHALYSCFDLLGRHVTGHSLKTGRVLAATFVSYAFNLNFGALVGGIAFRYRLYSRFGLDVAVVTHILAMSMLTNWLGYVLLAGLVFLGRPISLPPDWEFDMAGLRMLGGALLAAAAAYLLLCAFSRRRLWTIRRQRFVLPSFRLALVQFGMSSANWLLIAGTIHILLARQFAFPEVLGILLIAAIAGVLTHVPAGLGVIEAVFIGLLSHRIAQGELVAALLTYRLVYYLVPLAVAAVMYLTLETGAARRRRHA
ncbi:MAG TPA: lysylphosphatidylglycerol synthase domain-containing protein [Paucimonas sp.]|nr:lysylphosphatidylglycerol synthase domain-containing protein [Paucimonas sp.]